jgi:hypothetical protein
MMKQNTHVETSATLADLLPKVKSAGTVVKKRKFFASDSRKMHPALAKRCLGI